MQGKACNTVSLSLAGGPGGPTLLGPLSWFTDLPLQALVGPASAVGSKYVQEGWEHWLTKEEGLVLC